jgi:immune inhibitor A
VRLLGLVVGVCLLLGGSRALGAPPLDPPSGRGARPRSQSGALARLPFLRAPGIDASETRTTGATGTYRCVVILLQFRDNPADTINHTPADYQDLLFSVGTRPGGSLRDYYREVSRGQFDVDGIVTRWYTADSTYDYYTNNQSGFGSYPTNAAGMVADAIRQADPDVDFSGFDANGPSGVPDGIVDGLFVIHAGPGAEETDLLSQIWSHKFVVPGSPLVDGVRAGAYTTEPEEWGTSNAYESAGDLISRGVFCHEFGHVLGLPDIYDLTDSPTSTEGVGEWDLMGTGVYNHLSTQPIGTSPAHMSAWSKIKLGWVTPTWVLQDSLAVTIPPVESSGQVFRLWTNGDDTGEYFLVENRQPVGSDAGLVRSSNESGDGSSHGLIIWHVDDSVANNNNAAHKLLDVEEAGGPEFLLGRNGAQNLDIHRGAVASQLACGQTISVTGNRGDKYDPWPGARNATSFDGSCPASGSYCNGNPSQVAVRNIVETGTNVTADLYVTGVTVRRLAPAIDDSPFGGHPNNGNGLVEPGETVRLRLPLHNYALTATGSLIAKLAAGSLLTLSPDSITYASIPAGGTDSGSVVEATVQQPAPDPIGVPITMILEAAAGLVDADSVQVLVGTKTGLCDDFESTARHWGSTAEGCDGVNEWHREAGINHTPGGTWAWRLGPMGTVGSYSPSQDSRLVSQPIRLAGLADTLVFWQRYSSSPAEDGLSVEISTDGAETWTPLQPVSPGYSNGDHWSGTQPNFVEAKVPLAGYSGIVQISFRFHSTSTGLGLGWWIDDVAVTGSDECATTAIEVTRFDATPVTGRPAVLVSWGLADAVGATVGIDRASATAPRERIVTVPWESRTGQYEDSGVSAGLGYQYWITASRPGEPDATAGPIPVSVPAGVGDGSPPRVLAIGRIRPNPFSPNAAFSVSLDRDGPYVVRVYRADGSLVRTLADSRGRAGIQSLSWDGTDSRGRPAAAGLYFFELRAVSGVRVQKAILLR